MNSNFHSKLPYVGTTIFSKMSALAQEYGALNLAQGFPDFPTDPKLIDLLYQYTKEGYNQYAAMPGVLALREQIAAKVWDTHNVRVDVEDEITVTSGATQAIFTAIATLVEANDEVLLFEPAYDCYAPTLQLFGAKIIPVRLLAPDFYVDWDYVKCLVNAKTKLIIINTPNNPTGKIFTADDRKALEEIVLHSQAYILSDEVYEHIVFDGHRPFSMLQSEMLRDRSIVIASFGKLLHITGWKVGYCIAHAELMKEFRKVHQYNVFSVHPAVQLAIADYLLSSSSYRDLGTFFQQKRDYLTAGIASSRFKVLPSQGTYFLNLDYAELSDADELPYAESLVRKHHIALIPISAFYSTDVNQKILRLCFAKKEKTLQAAIELLNNI